MVVLCGGQGTRLGFDGPKGMYDIGLPSGKSLFQLQAERLRRVCALAAAAFGPAGAPRIPWYIMTSPLNDAATREFFASNDHFGIPKEDVFFFSQVRMAYCGATLHYSLSLSLSPLPKTITKRFCV